MKSCTHEGVWYQLRLRGAPRLNERFGQLEGQGPGEACLGCVQAWPGKGSCGKLDPAVGRIWVGRGNAVP